MIFRNVCIYLPVGTALTFQITSVFNTTVWETSDAGRSGLAHAVQELVYSLKSSNIFLNFRFSFSVDIDEVTNIFCQLA
jgi:hypothetical protein